jgi:hypothetical protein
MKFEPESFSAGKKVSLGINLLVLGSLMAFTIQFIVRKKKKT